jgi:hypothetical protein
MSPIPIVPIVPIIKETIVMEMIIPRMKETKDAPMMIVMTVASVNRVCCSH